MKAALRLTPIELLFIVIIAIPILGTFFPVEGYLSSQSFANPVGNPVADQRTTTICLIALYVIILTLYARGSHVLITRAFMNWPLFVFVGWVLLTALWAEIPTQSFNRSGRVLLSILYGVYMAEMFDRKTNVRIFSYALLIGLLGSTLVTVLAPGYSHVMDVRGAWRGAYAHKNQMGAVAALGMMFGGYTFGTRIIPRFASLFLLISGAGFIVLSNSMTSLLAIVLAGGFAYYLRSVAPVPNGNRVLALIVGAIAAASLAFLFVNFPTIFQFGGRDASLTGRTDVWDFTRQMIGVKPILGWGHGIWSTQLFQGYVMQELMWPAPHAHNAWLDMRLQLGIPGLMLGIFIAVTAVKRLFSAILVVQDPEYLLWAAVIIFQAVRSATETMYIDPSYMDMFWLAIAMVRLSALSKGQSQRTNPRFRYSRIAPDRMPPVPSYATNSREHP